MPNPTINSMTPVTSWPGHQAITIYGDGFVDGLTLTFVDPAGNAVDETQYVGLSVGPSRISLSIPGITTVGKWTARVVNHDGGDSGAFTFEVGPTINSMTPVTSWPGHQAITIYGDGFVDGLTLTFVDPAGNAVDETQYVGLSVGPGRLSLSIPGITAVGKWTARIFNPDGGDSGAFPFFVGPAIMSISPVASSPGHQPIIISGDGFQTGLRLIFTDPGGNAVDETQYVGLAVNPAEISLSIPGIAAVGKWTARVVNPDGGDSGPFPFLVV